MPDQPKSDHPTALDAIAAVDAAIAGRRTLKVFADPARPPAIPPDFIARLQPALEVAGMAPFHYACHAGHRGATATGSEAEAAAIEPWRVYLLDAPTCRRLIETIQTESQAASEPIWRDAPGSKIPRMLAAAGALALLCWLPDPPVPAATDSSPSTSTPAAPDTEDPLSRREAEREKRNREHLAAAAAYGQNLLVAATARGMASYWSSGGVLATERALGLCGVPAGQPLLGALFFFPQPEPDADFVTGKLRPLRSPASAWLQRVHLPDRG